MNIHDVQAVPAQPGTDNVVYGRADHGASPLLLGPELPRVLFTVALYGIALHARADLRSCVSGMRCVHEKGLGRPPSTQGRLLV